MSAQAARYEAGVSGEGAGFAPFNPLLWLFRALWEHKVVLVSVFVAGTLAVAALAGRLPDVYTASGLLEIDPDASNLLDDRGNSVFVQPETITETEVEVIRSGAVVVRAAEALGLVDVDTPEDERLEMIDAIQQKLSVTPTGRSYIVRVAYEGADRSRAAAIVNAVMGEYLDTEVSQQRSDSREAVALLSERLDELREDLDAKEQAVLDFRRTSRIAERAGTQILERQLTNLNEELIRAQSAQAAAAANAAQREGPADTLPEVVSSSLIQELRSQEAQQARAVTELETLYRPNHPRLIQARTALAELRDTIAAETRKIAQSLGASERIETRRLAAIEQEAERLREMITQQTEAEIELGQLEREVEAARRIYQTFLDRFNEVQGVTGLEEPDGRIIAAAVPPAQPSGPNRVVMVAGGAIVSGGLAAALAILLTLLDRRVHSAAQVAEITGIAPLDDVPPVPGAGRWRPKLTRGRRNAAFADAMNRLRGTLVLGSRSRGPAMVAFTGVDEDAGHAPLAAALAQACAVAGDEAVLVDLNFARPQLPRLFGVRNEFGVADLIAEGGDVEAALRSEKGSGLSYMLPGKGGEPSYYRDARMDDLLDALYERFDVLVLLLPAIALQPDAQAVAGVSDVAAVVVRAGDTERDDLLEVIDQLRFAANAERVATIFYRGRG